tara:strand:+ start:180 stop:458 length:279 start_codon:yes stop_codon:yes gene_type:complete
MPFKRLAGQALNILPDRMNLFLRYMSGVGNEGLELDESTLRSLRAATEKQDFLVDYIDRSNNLRRLASVEKPAYLYPDRTRTTVVMRGSEHW